jgi:anti-anti-sigma factor
MPANVGDEPARITSRRHHPKQERIMSATHEDFELEWHGNTVVIIPASNVEAMRWDLIEQAAEVVMAPLREQEVPMVVFDLSDVSYFGSVFLALLLRCHKFVKSRGGELVLAGASKMAAELLRVTALDTLWAIYDTREEALEAVSS